MTPRYTLKQLAYFVRTAEVGTTTHAASDFFISQSAMSAALSDLESALGVQLLLRRKGKGVSLTRSGQLLLPQARRLLAEAEDLASAAIDAQDHLTGHLTVGCFDMLASSILPPTIAEFTENFPGVTVDFIEGSRAELGEALASGKIEIAILLASTGLAGTEYIRIAELAPYVLLPADHRLARAPSVDLRELADEPLIFVGDDPTNDSLERAFNTIGETPNIKFRSRHMDHIRALVRHGLGYCMIMQGTRLTDSQARGIVSIPLSGSIPSDTIVVAHLEGLHVTRRAATFMDHLRQGIARRVARSTDSKEVSI